MALFLLKMAKTYTLQLEDDSMCQPLEGPGKTRIAFLVYVVPSLTLSAPEPQIELPQQFTQVQEIGISQRTDNAHEESLLTHLYPSSDTNSGYDTMPQREL